MSDLPRSLQTEIDRIYEDLQHALASEELRRIQTEFDELVQKETLRASLLRYYTEVPAPDPDTARAADVVLRWCSADLGTEPPPLHWMRPESDFEVCYHTRWGVREWSFITSPSNILGCCFMHPLTRSVWIRADRGLMSFPHYLSIVAHEVRHAAGADEADAQAYQADWLTRWFPHAGSFPHAFPVALMPSRTPSLCPRPPHPGDPHEVV